ncbi:mediator of RNA polymerase II transcription subunit 30 [Lingula anatina]|uniref:Mediator of RNA polymerase II transcription subunit 30 n=1 Tax=Lingula anatina TaxID=7574 RepID=A0A1S3J7I7_LINAN|nr:mediator of RNA polymerase II transcription subunit 30 [Lingula anatina]|eukprot:XP_013405819.1 mediator of RNA polymerase II transcription subunit 30 [Lingula anatina]
MANPGPYQQYQYQQQRQQQQQQYNQPGGTAMHQQPPPSLQQQFSDSHQGSLHQGQGSWGGQGQTQLASPTKDVNTASLCKTGQETVQEIVQKTLEIFQVLHQLKLPNNTAGNSVQMYQDKKAKLEDHMKAIQVSFKKLRLMYNKVQEICQHFDTKQTECLIPYINGPEVDDGGAHATEAVRYSSEEHREIAEQIRNKNRHLKEIIDQLRTVIWEINTMAAMRKT